MTLLGFGSRKQVKRAKRVVAEVGAVAGETFGDLVDQVAKIPKQNARGFGSLFNAVLPAPRNDDFSIIAGFEPVLLELVHHMGIAELTITELAERPSLAGLLRALLQHVGTIRLVGEFAVRSRNRYAALDVITL